MTQTPRSKRPTTKGLAVSGKTLACVAAVVVGILFKFWLIAGTDIVDDTHDPSEYVLQILYPGFGGLGYGPGTGYFGRIFYDLGIPFRLGIEGVYIGACLLVLKALIDWPGRTLLATGLFLFALLDPAVAEQFAQMFSDQVWMLESMIGLACLVFAVRSDSLPRWPWLVTAGIALGFSTITRSMIVPLVTAVTLVGVASAAILLFNRSWRANLSQFASLAIALWSVLLSVGIIYQGVCVYNAKKFGFHGISVTDSREYRSLYLCLQSVGPPTGDTYFPIGAERRRLIAQAGPNSRWLMDELDHDDLDNEGGVSQYHRYDIPSGLFHWAVFHVVLADKHGDLQQTFAFFRAVEDEIAEAGRRGVFEVQPGLPWPDRRLNVVLGALPLEADVTVQSTLYEPASLRLYSSQDLARFKDANFNAALHRREVGKSPLRDHVWASLTEIYSAIYGLPLFATFLLTLVLSAVVEVWRWRWLEPRALDYLMPHVFSVFFFCIMGWYAIFGASGVHQDTRYMMFNHVMLPILVSFYLCRNARLLSAKR